MALIVFLFPLIIGVGFGAMIGRWWLLPVGAAVGALWMLVTAFNGGFGGDFYQSNDIRAGFNAGATAFFFVVILAGMAIGNRAHVPLLRTRLFRLPEDDAPRHEAERPEMPPAHDPRHD
jgi:hypothetical protein